MNASTSDLKPRSCCHASPKNSGANHKTSAASAHHSHGHHHHTGAVPADGEMPAAYEAVYMGLPHERYLRPRFWVAALLGLPVMVLAMGEMVAPDLFHRFDARMLSWLQLALTTPIFFWAGAPLNRRWWASIRDRSTNMFTLIVTGTGAAYL